MKQSKITYTEKYCNDRHQDDVYNGFTPFKNEKDEYIEERKVVMYAQEWNHGNALVFEIWEKWQKSVVKDDEIDFTQGERKLADSWVYDYPTNDLYIKPTNDQVFLMRALVDGDLRGRYAEQIARNLYVQLFVLAPQSPMNDFLPEVVKFWLKNWKP